jgi:hypothetical protein
MAKTPKAADTVLMDGEQFVITAEPDSRGICVFENPGKKVKCTGAELVYDKDEDLWYLPGRILSMEQKMAASRMQDRKELPGSPGRQPGSAPHPDEHLAIWKHSAFQAHK